jgi:hypothetical protein
MWNIVIPTLIILNASQKISAVICVLFCLSQLTTIKFPHLVRVRALRAATYIATSVYFGSFILLSAQYPGGSQWAKNIILIGPIYLVVVVVWRTWFPHKTIAGVSILGPEFQRRVE